jgi:nitrile hydratase
VTFSPGQKVRVAARMHEGHHRTPGYLKGRAGVVERVHGAFTDPETRAYGADGLPRRTLHLVGFVPGDLWPQNAAARDDRLYADIFEHWLEEDA